jgi:hypothetical protein
LAGTFEGQEHFLAPQIFLPVSVVDDQDIRETGKERRTLLPYHVPFAPAASSHPSINAELQFFFEG